MINLLLVASMHKGKVQLSYIYPELLLTNNEWREMLRSGVDREKLAAFKVVDEEHNLCKTVLKLAVATT